jgi:hypothetical protein
MEGRKQPFEIAGLEIAKCRHYFLIYTAPVSEGRLEGLGPEPNFKRVSNPNEDFGSVKRRKKRTTGLEPATSSLGSSRSTN